MIENIEGLFIQTVPAHDVLDSICAFLPPDISHEAVKLAVVEALAGHVVYLPKQLKNEMRNREMLKRFTGRNIGALCCEYQITRAHFYRLLKRDRAKKFTSFKK